MKNHTTVKLTLLFRSFEIFFKRDSESKMANSLGVVVKLPHTNIPWMQIDASELNLVKTRFVQKEQESRETRKKKESREEDVFDENVVFIQVFVFSFFFVSSFVIDFDE